ncbi:MAG TPA: D-alanyl-D-alanine carboxypeptidase/D-alanyl-D-alanine-endopeptidase [Chitinophagaceae bacterium]|nr:D-alanyl-D-alanine carboxypeptidase/D-alanyl-D-alanine-endopeptidase [Chitinophagaceae bacterium]
MIGRYVGWKNLLLIPFYLFLVSCSMQKKLSRSAREFAKNPSLQNAQVGISIYDPAVNQFICNYQADQYFVPASNTKIPTCYAAMKYLGDSLVAFRYRTLPGNDLLIIPSGDPTFLHPDFSSEATIRFLKKYNQLFLVNNNFHNQRYGPGWSWDDYQDDYMPENNALPLYGNMVTFTLEKGRVKVHPKYFEKLIATETKQPAGFRVARSFGLNDFSFSPGADQHATLPFSTGNLLNPGSLSLPAALLADTLQKTVSQISLPYSQYQPFVAFHSQPVDSLLTIMMHRSDNFFAEQSLLMVSDTLLDEMDSQKIIDHLLQSSFRDLPQQPHWVDGSGLSRYNLFTPQDFIRILQRLQQEFGIQRLKTIFPSGDSGTLKTFYKALGENLYAKTGSMTGVLALSGYLYTKKKRLLLFSILVNNYRGSSKPVRESMEGFLFSIFNSY